MYLHYEHKGILVHKANASLSYNESSLLFNFEVNYA